MSDNSDQVEQVDSAVADASKETEAIVESMDDYDETKEREYRKVPVTVKAHRTLKEERIETLEGMMTAMPGDWIITGVNGERYPCKDEIFRKTYRRA